MSIPAVVRCAALMIAAPASGQGKTMVTAALARLHVRQGRRVRVFKCGPDFIDGQIHALASGAEVDNLDLWMCGAEEIARRLHAAASEADLILVEGVMGLYDGSPSAAALARQFGLPVLAVIDARAMAQTFAAIAWGLANFEPELPFAGVLANQVGSARHAQLLQEALPASMRWFGALPREPAASLPERHLGLWQAAEVSDLEARLDRLGEHLQASAADITALPAAVEFAAPAARSLEPLLAGRRIAIARDAAFGFLYAANLATLRALGAELAFFSPLAGDSLPAACDAVWLPGGYPELHVAALQRNQALWAALHRHVAAGKPVLAEGGGFICLLEQLVDDAGQAHPLGGLLPGEARMHSRLVGLGMQALARPAGELRGHSFHYSAVDTPLSPWLQAQRAEGAAGEPVYRQQALIASYVHFWFASAPAVVAEIFGQGPDPV